MNFHTQYHRDPSPEQASDLIEYVTTDLGRGGVVVDRAGEVGEERLEAFAIAAAREDMIRQYTAAFRDYHDPEELVEVAKGVARDRLDGEWMVGVHVSNPGNPHVHIAEAGSASELYMDQSDIHAFREDLAERIGEPYGGS